MRFLFVLLVVLYLATCSVQAKGKQSIFKPNQSYTVAYLTSASSSIDSCSFSIIKIGNKTFVKDGESNTLINLDMVFSIFENSKSCN